MAQLRLTRSPHILGRRVSARTIAWSSLFCILVLGAFLRLLQLGHDSLWTDEGFSVRLVRSGASSFFDQTTSADPNPPLYYVLLRAWTALFGDSEAALRSLSVFLGIVLVYAMYELGRRLSGIRVGIASALLTAVSEFLVHYSQEARAYALLALLTALSYLCLLRLLDRWNLWSAAAYILATTALLYTHVYGFFVLAAQAAFLAIKVVRWPTESGRKRHELVRWSTMLAIPLLLTIPWLVVFARHARAEVEGAANAKLGWLDAPTLRDLPGALSGYAGSSLSLAVVLALAAAAGVIAVRRTTTRETTSGAEAVARQLAGDRNVVLLVLWLAVPIVVPFALSLAVTPFYQFKYTIPAALAFYLLVALGLQSLGPRLNVAALAAVGVAFLIPTARYYSNPTEGWREATAFIAARAEPGDVIVFDSDVGQKNAFAYYWKRPEIEQVAGSRFAGLSEQDLAAVRTAAENHRRVWLVVSHSRDPRGRLLGEIEGAHDLRSQTDFVGIRVLRFE